MMLTGLSVLHYLNSLIRLSSNTAILYTHIAGSKTLLTFTQHIVSEPFHALTDRPHKTATHAVYITAPV